MSFLETDAGQFWFTVAAYVSAILPWTVISSTDFINATWRSVKHTRKAGYRDLLWTFLPLGYVIFYAVIQYNDAEYSELCASVIAAVLAALLGLRTIWGLWQLREFRKWAERSIAALDVMGIKYCLHGYDEHSMANMTFAQISDEILVNEKIVDNQIMHGDVHCYLKFGSMELLRTHEADFGLLGPILTAVRWLTFLAAMLCEYVLRTAGKGQRRLKQVPMKPADVWIRWAATFASQGLKHWMSEFEVATDPRMHDSIERLPLSTQFHQKGMYFGAEVLASASLHLWSDFGGNTGLSPMLWDVWDEDSNMNDGRVVKQELFKDAIEKGECLPFEANHVEHLRPTETERGEKYYGYDAYRELLGEFVSELPVRSSFVTEMRKFEVNMLEWLTILLHLGTTALKLGYNVLPDNKGCDLDFGQVDSISQERERDNLKSCMGLTAPAIPLSRSNEAVILLYSQLALKEHDKVTELYGSAGPVSGIPILKNVVSMASDGNRLVTKVGELVDLWVSFVCAEQIQFMVDNLNHEWERICLGHEQERRAAVQQCERHEHWGLQEAHKELEKKRLEKRIADMSHRYGYLDQFVTFMGYRMESVRTIVGRWVKAHEGSCADDLFKNVMADVMDESTILVELSHSLTFALKRPAKSKILQKRGVQCRLIWELQNQLESKLMKLEGGVEELDNKWAGVATVMLFLLSFPGLAVRVQHSNEVSGILETGEGNGDCVISLGCCGLNDGSDKGSQAAKDKEHYGILVDVNVACGPQHIGMRIVIDTANICSLQLKSDNQEVFNWHWWRDAFLGRLEGFQEWRREVGIPAISLDWDGRRDNSTTIQHFEAITQSMFTTWTEWPPFRTDFCRFELETEKFLKEPGTMGPKTASVKNWNTNYSLNIGELQLLKVRPICYMDAREDVLRDACLLVKETMKRRWDPHAAELVNDIQEHEKKDVVKNIMRVARSVNGFRASMYYQLAAVEHGSTEGLKKSLDMLFRNQQMHDSFSRATVLLHNFMSTVFTWRGSHLEVEEGRDEEVDSVILPACERLMMRLNDNEYDVEKLYVLIGTCLATDAGRHEGKVMSMMQKLIFYCYGRKSQVVSQLSMAKIMIVIEHQGGDSNCLSRRNSAPAQQPAHIISTENHRTLRSVLELLVSKSGPPRREENKARSASERRYRIHLNKFRGSVPNESDLSSEWTDQEQHLTVEHRAFFEALTGLGCLLHNGVLGVGVDSRRAYDLFDRAIREGKHVTAMTNMALLLETGAEGVPADPDRAVTLYERAIREGNHIDALEDLALLLLKGSEGVAANPRRAVELYERAAEAGSVSAMNNLGLLLWGGEEGVPTDIPRAFKLFEDAIEIGSFGPAMINLGALLMEGEHITRDAPRAVRLYERAIAERNLAGAMVNLGHVLEKGAEGVPADGRRAVQLYKTAIEESGNLTAMHSYGTLLLRGTEGVDVDARQAVALFERAIEGGYVDCMYQLALVLANGAEGVATDLARAARLYEEAINESGHVQAMNNLGAMLQYGRGVEENVLRAKELYERAVREGGLVEAMLNLAVLFLYGADGIEVDAEKAIRLYERAVQEGKNERAMYRLAAIFWNGESGVDVDTGRALEMFNMMADVCGSADAMWTIAWIYGKGENGVQRNMEKSKALVRRAIATQQRTEKVGCLNEVWLGFKEGADGFEVDALLAREIVLYVATVMRGLTVSEEEAAKFLSGGS